MGADELYMKLKNTTDEHIIDSFKVFSSEVEMRTAFNEYYELSWDNMKRKAAIYRWIFVNKYHVKGERKLGNLNRVESHPDYLKILPYVKKRFGNVQYLAMKTEGIEGPREEDVVDLKTTNFDFEHHNLRIFNKKGHRWYEVPLNAEYEEEMKQHIALHAKEIKEHHDCVFFSLNPVQKRDHISKDYLRRVFREASNALGLENVYEKSIDGRNLHLDTLHGMRGHAATRVYEKSGHDLVKVQELLDHRPGSIKVTMCYLEKKPSEDLRELI